MHIIGRKGHYEGLVVFSGRCGNVTQMVYAIYHWWGLRKSGAPSAEVPKTANSTTPPFFASAQCVMLYYTLLRTIMLILNAWSRVVFRRIIIV